MRPVWRPSRLHSVAPWRTTQTSWLAAAGSASRHDAGHAGRLLGPAAVMPRRAGAAVVGAPRALLVGCTTCGYSVRIGSTMRHDSSIGVLAGEQRRVALHGLLDQQLVGLGADVGALGSGAGARVIGSAIIVVARGLLQPGEGGEVVGLGLDADPVAAAGGRASCDPQRPGRRRELDGHLGDGLGQGLAGPQEERARRPSGASRSRGGRRRRSRCRSRASRRGRRR